MTRQRDFKGVIRRGDWLLACHPIRLHHWFWLPNLCLWPGRGWSLGFLCFEIGRVR